MLSGTISEAVSEIKKGQDGDYPWRVQELTFTNAGEGLLQAYSCLFSIPNYWPYGYFSSKTRCELPGKLFRAKASGKLGDQHNFMSPGTFDVLNRYRMRDGRLYIAWRVKAPKERVEGGQFSYVRLSDGPWEVWNNRNTQSEIVWTIKTMCDDQWKSECIQVEPQKDGWFDVQLVLDPQELTLQVNHKDIGRFAHDTYNENFSPQFGSGQLLKGGGEITSDYREVFVHSIPYPYKGLNFAEGPEDIRPEDEAIVGYIVKCAHEVQRAGEGDIIELKDGSLLSVFTYYSESGCWDSSPAYIAGSISRDGGRIWSKPYKIADREEGSEVNVMSVSLLRDKKGGLILVHNDRTPQMGEGDIIVRRNPDEGRKNDLMLLNNDGTRRKSERGMIIRGSTDEGKTWSPRQVVTPTNKNLHLANNACLTRLSSGRIVLATREYCADGIRWPYVNYSDDDGKTWKAGNHVPDPGLATVQKQGQNVNEPSACELADGRLMMTMRSVAGGQFFSWSSDQGETWTRPVLSPLRGACSPGILRRIPNSDDILAVWTYGYSGRTPLVSAISSDGGLTWKHLKLVEQSQYHVYCYTSCTFIGDRVLLSYMAAPGFTSQFRFEANPRYQDLRFISLPLKWFYRDPKLD